MQSVHAWYDQLAAAMRWQAEKLAELERGLRQLQEEFRSEVQAIRERPPVHVEKIEYSFDQLKIESLEGTLHIGVSPPGEKAIDDFLIQDRPIVLSDPETYAGMQDIKDELDRYLASDCWDELRQYEAEYRLILGQHYKDAMIRDLRSQVHDRVEHYVKRALAKRSLTKKAAVNPSPAAPSVSPSASTSAADPWHAAQVDEEGQPERGFDGEHGISVELIAEKVKQDVRAAIRQHLEKISANQRERGNPD